MAEFESVSRSSHFRALHVKLKESLSVLQKYIPPLSKPNCENDSVIKYVPFDHC